MGVWKIGEKAEKTEKTEKIKRRNKLYP